MREQVHQIREELQGRIEIQHKIFREEVRSETEEKQTETRKEVAVLQNFIRRS